MGEKQYLIDTDKPQAADRERSEEIAKQLHEVSHNDLEHAERAHKDRQTTAEMLQKAKELANDPGDVTSNSARPIERRRGSLSKKQLSKAYDSQMHHAREHMSSPAKIFSKIVHSKPIETSSDVIGSTIARPNALLIGSITAFVVVTVLYFLAKHYGYQLSGFETIGAFVTGWLLGLFVDYVAVAFRGLNN